DGEPQPPTGERPHWDAPVNEPGDEPVVTRAAEPSYAEETPTPAPAPAPAAPEAHEPRRRRSTVREPAPISFGGEHETTAPTPDHAAPHPAEAPQPVISSEEDEAQANRPRRSGWWSRRVLGKE